MPLYLVGKIKKRTFALANQKQVLMRTPKLITATGD